MSSESLDVRSGRYIPQANSPVISTSDQIAGIGGESEVGNSIFVAFEYVVDAGGGTGEGVGTGGLVGGGRGEEASIVGEFDAGDSAFVGWESLVKLVGFEGFSWVYC